MRYTYYIINLVCKAILYSVDTNYINNMLEYDKDDDNSDIPIKVSTFENLLRTNDELAKLNV